MATRMARIQGALGARDFHRGGFGFAERTATQQGGPAEKQSPRCGARAVVEELTYSSLRTILHRFSSHIDTNNETATGPQRRIGHTRILHCSWERKSLLGCPPFFLRRES